MNEVECFSKYLGVSVEILQMQFFFLADVCVLKIKDTIVLSVKIASKTKENFL